MEKNLNVGLSLLTHSCTGALEMSAILLDVRPGDEIILPSFTFVSTGNAFALRGANLVFVDIDPNSLNLDIDAIEGAITSKTKAIIVVHYAGVCCDMERLLKISRQHGIPVIEDAAQAIGSNYKGQSLGSIGELSALSFHETKNISCGEGGALLINNPIYFHRAEIIREKGTDRSQFLRGEVDKYTWRDIGSSYLPSELLAAVLWSQLESQRQITLDRLKSWNYYHNRLESLQRNSLIRRPHVPEFCQHNGHMYFVILENPGQRPRLLEFLHAHGVNALTHYVPLHSSTYGSRVGRAFGDLRVTNLVAKSIVRLPLWVGLTEDKIEYVASKISSFFEAVN